MTKSATFASMIDHNKVVEVLRQVKDPTTGVDLISGKRVSELKIQDNQIFFTLSVDDLGQQAKFAINAECYALLKDHFKQAEVHIHFANKGAAGPKTVLPQVKNIIAVGSGKGGVGKSTISLNLALSLQKKGHKVGLLDADLYGPSIPTMMGLVSAKPKLQEVYGKPKLIPIEQHGIHVMSIGFVIEPEQAVILRGPRLSGVIKQFLNECIWPELDYLIIDLPPGTGDIQLTLVQSVPVTGAVIVTTPQQVALADAIKASNMFQLDSINIPIVGIIENMSWFTPAELPENKYFIFGKGGAQELANKYKTAVLGQVPLIQSIRENGDAGSPSAITDIPDIQEIWSKISDQFIKQVALRHDLYDPTQMVQVK